MNLQLEGTITKVLPLVEGTSKAGNAWKKQEFVLETNEQFSKTVFFTIFGDKVDEFKVAVNEFVKVSFDIESREYNGRYYTDIKAYNVEKISAGAAANVAAQPQPAPQPTFSAPQQEDSLPF